MPKFLSYKPPTAAGFVLGLTLLAQTALAVDSSWVGPNSGSWGEAANWSAGVPTSAGDSATIANSRLFLDGDRTLGALVLSGELAEIRTPGSLRFESLGPSMPVLSTLTEMPRRDMRVDAAIGVLPGQTLSIQTNSTASRLNLSGGLMPGNSALVKQGSGQLILSGASTDWFGSIDITEGQVRVANAQALGSATTTVLTGGSLAFDTPTDNEVFLTGGQFAVGAFDHAGDITLNGGIIRRQQNPTVSIRDTPRESSVGPTVLSSSISGTGGVVFANDSRDEFLIGGASTYRGETVVSAGNLIATSATAFGSPLEGTVVLGGRLSVQMATQEPFRVDGGQLVFSNEAGAPAGPLRIGGGGLVSLPYQEEYTLPVVVENGGGTVRFLGNLPMAWTGGATGTGDLHVQGSPAGGGLDIDASLDHQGDLTASDVNLNVANRYTGNTTTEGRVVLNHSEGMGLATTPIDVQQGELVLNTVPVGNREYVVRRGNLDIPAPLTIDAPVTLDGQLGGRIIGQGTFNGPINYTSGDQASLSGGTYNGPIRGTGRFRLTGSLVLNAANEINGRVISEGSSVTVNHPDALIPAATRVQRGLLEMNVLLRGTPFIKGPTFTGDPGTLQLNVDQKVERTWMVTSGTLQSNADIELERLILLSDSKLASATTVNDGTLQINHELLSVQRSALEGKVTGSGDIRTITSTLNISGDYSEFTGDFHAEQGTLALGRGDRFPASFTTNPESDFHVYAGGSIDSSSFSNIIENDIFIHNVKEPRISNGPFVDEVILRGRLDVGDQGSRVTSDVVIEGEITGNNLMMYGSDLTLRSAQTKLKGTLTLNDSLLLLDPQGSLHGIDTVVLESESRLVFTPSSNTDRLGDDVNLVARGARLQLSSTQAEPNLETIGALRIERGWNEISTRGNTGDPNSGIDIGQFSRNTGTVVEFERSGRVQTLNVDDFDRFDEHMIGGWAVTSRGLANLTEQGLATEVVFSTTSLENAGLTDHVNNTETTRLAKDTTVASLTDLAGTLSDLGGHRLTITSGGLLRQGRLENGSLTAGTGQPAELFLHRSGVIAADIVDNGPEGSVSVVVVDGQVLGGNNTYTGGTWILDNDMSSIRGGGTLQIADIAAIPLNDRVYVDGGEYNLSELDSGVVQLEELHLRSGGSVQSRDVPIDAEKIFLESGILSASLTGDGTIFKDRPSFVSLSKASPDFTGQVIVREGELSVAGDTVPNAEIMIKGGRVNFGISTVSNHITLDGGALTGGNLRGNLVVASESILSADGSTNLSGQLSGDADLTIQASLHPLEQRYVAIFGDTTQFTGDFNVESGTLRITTVAQLGSSKINVQRGARLYVDHPRARTRPTTVSNEIHLHTATLLGNADGAASHKSVLTGDVFVHEVAFIGTEREVPIDGVFEPGLDFAGRLLLDNHAEVFGILSGVEISGQLVIGEQNTWSMGPAFVDITGSIVGSTATSSIDFQGASSSLMLSHATFEAIDGGRLAVTINEETPTISLEGAKAGLAGDGQIVGDFSLSDGARLTPGASPGSLSIDGDLLLGANAHYEWEIGSTGIEPNVAWDRLNVTGSLTFTASADSPWMLEVIGLTSDLISPGSSWLIAQAEVLEGFDPSTVQILTGMGTDPGRVFALRVENGNSLYLVAIPEPTTLLLLLSGVGWGIGRRKVRAPRP